MVSYSPKEVLAMINTEVFMDILALHRQGYSMRWIAKKLGIHRNTVKKYITKKKQPHYQKQKRRESILSPFYQVILDWLDQDDYRATWIFDHLKDIGYTGGYDTVRYFVKNIKKQKAGLAFIRFETHPGRQAQMDWADFKILNDNGTSFFVYLFLMVLGFSRAMFACFVDRCSLQTFMDSHIAAFHYLGGVPAEIVYDNMRNVIVSDKTGHRHYNPELVDFATHYGFTPETCPAYSPWAKGKVERPIDYIRERFWRGYRFESIEKANTDLYYWLEAVANQRIHGTHRLPVNQRWHQEAAHLGPVPSKDYDTSVKVFRKVYKDCLVSFDTNRYVLPHQLVGKYVMLKVKNNTIRFFHDDQLIATYQAPEGKHGLIGEHRFYEALKRDQDQLARKYGRNKGAATRGLINASLFPQVMHRPLADYDRLVQGGASWNS
jgi:transposase